MRPSDGGHAVQTKLLGLVMILQPMSVLMTAQSLLLHPS